jgi:hypothetical protein
MSWRAVKACATLDECQMRPVRYLSVDDMEASLDVPSLYG